MLKRILALFLVVLMSINTLGAIVSDNDGSAFITKAEFDSLKNNFRSQIDQYNTSIDSKIDGAIASYLDGIKLSSPPKNLVEKFESATGDKMKWMYALPGQGTATRTPETTIQSVGYLTRRSVSNFWWDAGVWLTTAGGGGGYSISALVFGEQTFDRRYGYGQHLIRQATWGMHGTNDYYETIPDYWNYDAVLDNVSQATYGIYNETTSYTSTVTNGNGRGWLYQNINGLNVLKYYCTSLYPKIDLEYYVHWYKYFPAANWQTYTSSTGFNYDDVSIPTLETLNLELGKTNTLGTKYGADSTELGKYISGSANLIRLNNGNNYLNVVWAVPNDTTLYVNNEDYNGVISGIETSTVWPTALTWTNQRYSSLGLNTWQSTYPVTTTKYKSIEYVPETMVVGDFGNATLTTLAGSQVLNGNGAPVIEVDDAGQTIQVDFKLTTTSGTANCEVKFYNKKFINGNVATGETALATTTVDTGTEKNITFESNGKGIIYMFIKNTTNTNPITVETFTVK